jgi:hypothetical protein
MLSNSIDVTKLFENRAEAQWLEAVNFKIEVTRLQAQQVVSHPSADEHCAPADITYGFTQPQHVRVHSSKDNPHGKGRKGGLECE